MIQEVSVESTQESASSTLEPADAPEPAEPVPEEPAPEVRGRSSHQEPQEPQESQEPVPEEPAEPHPPPVPKTRVPPRVKPKAKPKAESTQVSAPKAKAKRAPRKPPEGSSASVRNAQDPPPAEETDRFAQYSNTDLMSEMLKRTDQGERRNSTLHCALIAEIIARSNDHRMEQKRSMYRSFLQ